MALSISQLYFEHHVTALGIGEPEPRISWRFEGDVVDWEQSAYDLEIQRPGDNMPNVFRVNSSDSILVPWPDSPLGSGEEATVRLKAYGQGDQPASTWSDAVTVEPGLLDPEDWHGALTIAADRETEVDEPHQPILFRKDFSTSSSISSARLYITALGVYEAEINGQRVGDLVMAPGWQSYDHRHEYNTYDVTDLLEEGPNAIGVVVGEGWYSGRIGFDQRVRNLWGDTLGLLSLLVLTDSQGNKTYITTDETWEATTGPIITSEIYDGEVYDSRLEQDGWSEPGFDFDGWLPVKELDPPKGELVSPDAPPVRRIEERRLENIITSPSGKTILDFGQNLVGWLRLQVEGPSGQTIQMVHTEVLENGEVATRPLRNAAATDNFTLSGGPQTWEPKFTFHGFRYVQVDGWPADTPLDEESVVAVVVHSDMLETGWFECSNPLINKLHQNVRWSMKGNFLSIPTDCPQRDERLGWTGDIHAFSRTANFLYDTSGFLRGWLKDTRFEQIASGANFPPYVVPDAMGTSTPVSIWGDVIVAAPWELYQTFGDDVMLKEQYVGAKAWVDEGIPRNGAGLWDRSTFQYGDWLDPKAPPEDAGDATTSAYLVSDAYLLHSTELLANISAYLSQSDDASYYNNWHSELAQEFQKAWITSNGTVANETQTGLALPLYFSLFDEPEHYTSALSRLIDLITENEFKVGTGFAGTHLLGHALTKYGESDTFYQMLLQTETPSWLYQVVMNATTTWERWDSMLPDGSINPGSMTSFNHYAVGSVAAWIHSVIGGLSPAEPGWKRINVEVIPGGELTEAKTQFLSPYGMVSTDWWFGDGSDDGKNAPGFHLVVEVPPNTRADVKLPAAEGEDAEVKEVGSGTHEYHVPGLQAK